MYCYDNEATALSVVPPDRTGDYTLFGYKMLPRLFDEGKETDFEMPPLHVEPLPRDYERIGYDAVGACVGGYTFQCSPLSCNNMAPHYRVNRYCLVDDLDYAVQVAQEVSVGISEHGPYCAIEVWRKQAPDRSTEVTSM